MKKSNILIIGITLIIFIGLIVLLIVNGAFDTGGRMIPLNTYENMETLINDIYKESGMELDSLETTEIDLNDEYAITSYTGLEDVSEIDMVVVSESMISIEPYSLVLVKVKDSIKIEEIKEKMVNNIDMRKWVCVNADVVYATNHNDVIIMIMGTEDLAKAQFDAFLSLVGTNIGKKLTREYEEVDF